MESAFPTRSEMESVFENKYTGKSESAWGPNNRKSFGYFTPDDYYEAIIDKQAGSGYSWADIGCGRDIFPSNPRLARAIASRCAAVVGIDPDPNINDNEFITEAHQMQIEAFETDRQFDLVTFRMVAEHIADPTETLKVVERVTKPGGRVVIYTPHKWAPVSIVARMTPMSVHHWVKARIWNTQERDTFPVEYKMNSRNELREAFSAVGFREESYWLVDDCRIFDNFRLMNKIDLMFWRFCRLSRLPYPEKCIIGVYVKDRVGETP